MMLLLAALSLAATQVTATTVAGYQGQLADTYTSLVTFPGSSQKPTTYQIACKSSGGCQVLSGQVVVTTAQLKFVHDGGGYLLFKVAANKVAADHTLPAEVVWTPSASLLATMKASPAWTSSVISKEHVDK